MSAQRNAPSPLLRVAVVGAGALGTWIAAALARGGHDVALVSRRPVPATLRVSGTESYEARVRPTTDASEVGAVDVVVLAVKAHDQAALRLAPLLGEATPILVVQNGIPAWYFHPGPGRIESVDPGGAVTAAIEPGRVLGCVAYIGAQVREPGTVAVRPEAGLVLGEPDRSRSERLQMVAAALVGAGFPVRVEDDVRVEVWTKLMGNASFNAISLLTRRGLASMARHPGTRALIAEIMREIAAVARALGAEPVIDVEARLAITERLGDHKPSTLQDFEAGRPLELAALVHAPLELAERTGTPAPALRAVGALADLVAAG